MLSAASSSSLVTLRESERVSEGVRECEQCRRGANRAGWSAQLYSVRLVQRRADRRCCPRDSDGVGSESALRPRHADRPTSRSRYAGRQVCGSWGLESSVLDRAAARARCSEERGAREWAQWGVGSRVLHSSSSRADSPLVSCGLGVYLHTCHCHLCPFDESKSQ